METCEVFVWIGLLCQQLAVSALMVKFSWGQYGDSSSLFKYARIASEGYVSAIGSMGYPIPKITLKVGLILPHKMGRAFSNLTVSYSSFG